MTPKDMTKYKEVFLTEAKEHVATMNAALVALEKSPGKTKYLHEIFCASHTLKGMSAAMDYSRMAALCHAMEDLLDAIRHDKIELKPCTETLYECFDSLETALKDLSQGAEEPDVTALTEKLTTILSTPATRNEATASDQLSSPTVDASEPVIEKVRTIGVKVEKLDVLMNLTEELLINKMGFDAISEDLQNPTLSAAVNSLDRLVTDLQYHIVQSRMVPVSFLFNRFPRMIRDLAKQEGKEIDLHTEGSDIELDRTVIDEMGECLIHLLRNAVDHGVETPEDRKNAGKNPQGRITLSATRARGFAVIEVADDGTGLDYEEIERTAHQRGILSSGTSREEIIDTIFSGNSTTKEVTAVSGRGFGLNIVRSKIKSLGGDVRVESAPGKGTRFVMEVPLTLAIIQTLFVHVSDATYAIPVSNVERLIRVDREDIKGFLNYEAVILDGEEIPITRLDLLFSKPASTQRMQPIVIVKKGAERLGLVVDSLSSTQDVVIKPLNRAVRESRYFSGSTIVGSGQAVLILDTANLIMSKRTFVRATDTDKTQTISALSG
jgi:two-component system chemotaxis sensor kinase CheA